MTEKSVPLNIENGPNFAGSSITVKPNATGPIVKFTLTNNDTDEVSVELLVNGEKKHVFEGIKPGETIKKEFPKAELQLQGQQIKHCRWKPGAFFGLINQTTGGDCFWECPTGKNTVKVNLQIQNQDYRLPVTPLELKSGETFLPLTFANGDAFKGSTATIKPAGDKEPTVKFTIINNNLGLLSEQVGIPSVVLVGEKALIGIPVPVTLEIIVDGEVKKTVEGIQDGAIRQVSFKKSDLELQGHTIKHCRWRSVNYAPSWTTGGECSWECPKGKNIVKVKLYIDAYSTAK